MVKHLFEDGNYKRFDSQREQKEAKFLPPESISQEKNGEKDPPRTQPEIIGKEPIKRCIPMAIDGVEDGHVQRKRLEGVDGMIRVRFTGIVMRTQRREDGKWGCGCPLMLRGHRRE